MRWPADSPAGLLESWRGFGPALWSCPQGQLTATDRRPELDSERMHHLHANALGRIGELALREFLVGKI